MAETKQIGRVEEVDVCAYGRQARLRVEFKLADGATRALLAAITNELVVDYLGVWGEVELQATVKKLCWVVHTDTAILALAPLMEDEGQTLDLIPNAQEPPVAVAPERATTPATAPEADEKPTPDQGARWKACIASARALKLNIEHCRPKPGMLRDEVEGLLKIAEALVAGEQQKEVAA